jgi:tetraacyldisaccharide 4'-kinase
MAQRLQGVPIVKGKDRYEAGMFSLQEVSGHKPGSGGMHDGDATRRAQPTVLFLLDDGFQHWRLYRDRDIVLIDAGDPFGNGRLLPKGRLREPLSALARADVIVLTKAGMDPAAEPDALIQKIRRYNDHAPVHASAHAPVCVMSPSGKKKPVAWLRGKRVFGFCGLGNPESFRKTLMASGSELGGFRVFRDHYQYRAEDIAALAAEARSSGSSWIVTTAKDMVRLGSLDLPENILIIEIEFSADRSFYEDVFAPG